MDLTSLILAPVRVPLRLAAALDDLTAIADRARREPDPVEEVEARIDGALAQLTVLTEVARELTQVARQIRDGGRELTEVAKAIHDGGQDLTAVAEDLEDETERIADTVSPLQGAAQKVGRLTRRPG